MVASRISFPCEAGEGADCRRQERLRTAELARRASAGMARVRRMGAIVEKPSHLLPESLAPISAPNATV